MGTDLHNRSGRDKHVVENEITAHSHNGKDCDLFLLSGMYNVWMSSFIAHCQKVQQQLRTHQLYCLPSSNSGLHRTSLTASLLASNVALQFQE